VVDCFSPSPLCKHRSALRGTPGSACPQPEPNATELPSCAPISARNAQRRRRRRRWWRDDEGARRSGPEAQVLRHVLWHALRNALRNCAASLACSSFTCRLGKAWGAVEHDACHDEYLYASVLRTRGGLVLPMRGSGEVCASAGVQGAWVGGVGVKPIRACLTRRSPIAECNCT